MLEHTSMYLPLLDEEPVYPDFYTRLGPCELQDPVWAKMSALTAGVNKKRKKSDTKPQAQINKCNNEKRRREQENIYIEELAELISANFADMSSLSVKPDKCAILQETVNQIRSIKQRETAANSSDPVQQGEVSSSRPTILSNEVYGPLLLEALEGFLFVVNAEGKVEHVTENVATYIKYTQDEVLGKSIYNFIHHGDHARFSASLLPMSIGWGAESNNRSRSFSCRLLIKSPDNLEESMEEKQQRVSHYELMHISSTQLRDQVTVSDEDTGDSGPCLLCVASRITHRDKVVSSAGIEQFTTKLDTTGKIIGVDTSGVSANYSKFLNKDLVGRVLQELCMPNEINKLSLHLKETLNTGQATSSIYRLRLGPDKFVAVQTKSKLFKAHPIANPGETDFVMATHSIIGENDSSGPSDPGGGSSNNSVGGPLMTSVANGTVPSTRNGAPVSSGSDTALVSNTLINATNSATFNSLYIENDIFDISSTLELDAANWTDTQGRPDSRQSITPGNLTPASTPTPRPPSQPIAQSPLQHFVAQASPSIPNPTTPGSNFYNTFSFSPINDTTNYQTLEDQKDTKMNVMDEASSIQSSNQDSNRLRILLTQKPNTTESPANSTCESKSNSNDHKILKGLLKQQDDEDDRNGDRSSRTGRTMPCSSQLGDMAKPSCGPNKLLEKLLNDKPANEENDSRQNKKMQNEFIDHIWNKDEIKQEPQQPNDSQSIFARIPSPPNSRKRPSEECDDGHPSKRPSDAVSSSGTSKLCEKNKMLAMLLAKQPSNIPQTIPHIPPSELTATPQERLPRITPAAELNKGVPNRIAMAQNIPSQNLMNNNNRMQQRPAGRPQSTNNYLNQLTIDNTQRNQRQQYQVDTYATQGISSTEWDRNRQVVESDSMLSLILDEVVENETPPIDSETALTNRNITNDEKLAISIIEKNLQNCEVHLKNPALGLPATPPAYSQPTTTQNNQAFVPPPNYVPRGNINMPRTSPALRPGVVGGASTQMTPQQQQLLVQQNRNKLLMQQEQHKRRLLQQQQQQIIVPSAGPSTSIAAADINPGLQSIDSLLNNTVAPNVSLQRSASVPEQQVSPNYVNQFNQNQGQRMNNQQPYSPHQQLPSPLNQQAGFPPTTIGNYQQPNSRLSPHPPFTQQLSPRQGYPQVTTQNSAAWPQQQARLSVQQQQNPMLNAQLTNNYVTPNRQSYSVQRAQQQQQRAIGSPGAAATRHSPYPTDAFPPPASPNATFNQQQNQYLRLQRTNSAPTATTQLPGGLGSPRPYGRDHPPHPSQYPIPHPNSSPLPHPNTAPHPMMYPQQDSPYMYDQSGLQMSGYGTDRGRPGLTTHLQGGVSGAGTTSEYVRQELRAVVGARTGQTQPGAARPQTQMMNQNVTVPADLESLGLSFDMPPTGASESPKLWGAMASDMGALSPQAASSRTTTEAGDGKSSSSLLQKLLSE